jgi:hypothetical protein
MARKRGARTKLTPMRQQALVQALRVGCSHRAAFGTRALTTRHFIAGYKQAKRAKCPMSNFATAYDAPRDNS